MVTEFFQQEIHAGLCNALLNSIIPPYMNHLIFLFL